jgi:hypothetical protein
MSSLMIGSRIYGVTPDIGGFHVKPIASVQNSQSYVQLSEVVTEKQQNIKKRKFVNELIKS